MVGTAERMNVVKEERILPGTELQPSHIQPLFIVIIIIIIIIITTTATIFNR
jgi:hypothetical protein